MLEFLSQIDWTAFLIAMFVIELTPGPNMSWLAATSARYGRKAGVIAVFGVTLGLAVQVIAAAAGLSTIFTHFPVVYQIMRWAGVIFMLWLAWEAFSDVGTASSTMDHSSSGFTRGFIANILNPKALLFYIAVVAQFASPSHGGLWLQVLILGSVHLLVSIIVHLSIVMLGARFGQTFKSWSTTLYARLIFSLSIFAIAIWIAIST